MRVLASRHGHENTGDVGLAADQGRPRSAQQFASKVHQSRQRIEEEIERRGRGSGRERGACAGTVEGRPPHAVHGEERALPIDHQNTPMAGSSFATGFRATRLVRPGKITFADHDPRMPNKPLTGEATTGAVVQRAALVLSSDRIRKRLVLAFDLLGDREAALGLLVGAPRELLREIARSPGVSPELRRDRRLEETIRN